jgi:hypothetical protein
MRAANSWRNSVEKNFEIKKRTRETKKMAEKNSGADFGWSGRSAPPMFQLSLNQSAMPAIALIRLSQR